jgi:hypothetical protein
MKVWSYPVGYVHDKPCGVFTAAGIEPFWEALGVYGIWDGFEETLQVEWLKGNMVLAAPDFPVLSKLIQMEIDNATVKAEDVPALLREVEIGRANCTNPLGIAVFEALKACGTLALAVRFLHSGLARVRSGVLLGHATSFRARGQTIVIWIPVY